MLFQSASAIHGDLCVAENILSFCACIAAEGDTDARHDDDLVTVQVEWDSQSLLKALRYPHGIAGIMKFLYEHGKLVTTRRARVLLPTVGSAAFLSNSGDKTVSASRRQAVKRCAI